MTTPPVVLKVRDGWDRFFVVIQRLLIMWMIACLIIPGVFDVNEDQWAGTRFYAAGVVWWMIKAHRLEREYWERVATPCRHEKVSTRD